MLDRFNVLLSFGCRFGGHAVEAPFDELCLEREKVSKMDNVVIEFNSSYRVFLVMVYEAAYSFVRVLSINILPLHSFENTF